MYKIAQMCCKFKQISDRCFYETSNNNKYIVLIIPIGGGNGKLSKSRVIFFNKDAEFPTPLDLDHPSTDPIIVFSPNDKYVIIQFQDNTVKIFDIHQKKEIYSKKVSEGTVTQLLIPRRENYLLIIFNDGRVETNSFNDDFQPLFEHGPILRYKHERYCINFTIEDVFRSSKKYNMIHGMTALHICSLFGDQFLSQKYKYDQEHRIPNLVDNYGRTPLHYLLAHITAKGFEKKILVEYILDYLDDSQTTKEETFLVTNSLSNIFTDIIQNLEASLTVRFVKLFVCSSYSAKEKPSIFLPQCGIFTISSSSPVNGKGFIDVQNMPFSLTWLLLPILYKVLLIVLSGLSSERPSEYSRKTLRLHLDYHPASDDILEMTLALSKIKYEDLFDLPTVSFFTYYIWSVTYIINILLACWFSLLMITLSLYINEGQNEGPDSRLERMVIVVFATFGLLIEGIQILTIKSRYLLDLWNIIDLSSLILMIFVVGDIVKFDDELTKNWLVALAILTGYARWISYLRLFSSTRNLIEIIINILKDMRGFMVIMLLITVAFTLIFLQFQRENQEEFLVQLYNTYQLWYSITDQIDATTTSIQVLLSLMLFTLPVVLLNMLISIMANSYEKVQSKRQMTECKTKMDMSLEAIAIIRILTRRKQKRSYLHFLVPMQLNIDGEDVSAREEEWDGKINEIRKQIVQAKAAMKEDIANQTSSINNQISGIKNEISSLRNQISTEMNEIKSQLQKIAQGFGF